MKVALCQLRSPDTLAESVLAHVRAVEQGAEAKCELALFPELSLTGYSMADAESRTIDPASPLLDPLAAVSQAKSIDIAVGAPLCAPGGGVEIGVIVFRPDGSRLRYAKHILHADEEAVFVQGRSCLDLALSSHTVAFGVCYEALQPAHGAAALEHGATLYSAMVAKHSTGMEEAHRYLSTFARLNRIPVLIVNAVGLCDGFECSGGSAGWDTNGHCLRQLEGEEGVLVVDV